MSMAHISGIPCAVVGRCGADSQPLKTYGEHRVCAAPNCGTVLSRYNKDSVCAVHTGYKQPRARRKLVPIKSVAPAVDEMLSKGLTQAQIAQSANVSDNAVRAVQRRSQPYITSRVAEALWKAAMAAQEQDDDQRYIDAGPVREHVLALVASGMTFNGVARSAGIGRSSAHGVATRNKYVRAYIAKRILAVQVPR